MTTPWWQEGPVDVVDGRLALAGQDLASLARAHGTPLYVLDVTDVERRAASLDEAMAAAGLTDRAVRLALKAQREPEVLRRLAALPAGAPGAGVGVDACSPGEVLHALGHGLPADRISLTGTNMTDADLRVALDAGVHVNVDLLTQLRRLGRLAPAGTRAGIRINPGIGVAAAGEDSQYSSQRAPTKFGLLMTEIEQAASIADEHGLLLDTVHLHVASRLFDAGLPRLSTVLRRAAEAVRRLRIAGHDVREVNVGGGLGVRQFEAENHLDLRAWADVVAAELGGLGVTVGVEPGEFLARRSGVLLAEVVTVADRQGSTFVGLDVGWNVWSDWFVYEEEQTIVPVLAPLAPPTQTVTWAGNINEGNDLFGIDVPAGGVAEGDVVAMLFAGSYGTSMMHRHCLRPLATCVFIEDGSVSARGPQLDLP